MSDNKDKVENKIENKIEDKVEDKVKDKEFICENCGKVFSSLNRKNNHFKICNYKNLEKEITNLKFEIFLLKSLNHNKGKIYDKLYKLYKNDIENFYNLTNIDDDNINTNIDINKNSDINSDINSNSDSNNDIISNSVNSETDVD